jgi:hypothetical protein
MGARIRSVVQGPEGELWVLEDERLDSHETNTAALSCGARDYEPL